MSFVGGAVGGAPRVALLPHLQRGEGTFILDYLGTAMMDSRCSYSPQMMPWIIAEILQFSATTKVVLSIKNGGLRCSCFKTGQVIFESERLSGTESMEVRLDHLGDYRNSFLLLFPANDIYIHSRLFAASSPPQVTEVLWTMKESSTSSSKSPIRSSSPSRLLAVGPDSISFEVLYVGKLRMSYRKAPPTFIDEALLKFKTHDEEKTRRDSISQDSLWNSSSESIGSRPRIMIQESEESEGSEDVKGESEGSTVKGEETGSSERSKVKTEEERSKVKTEEERSGVKGEEMSHPLMQLDMPSATSSRVRNPSGDAYLVKSMSLPVEPMRSRALSTGHLPRNNQPDTNKIGSSHYNRTMILIVGKCEMQIISPDAKTLLFSKSFREIYQSSQGLSNKEYFGFICRESSGTEGQSSSNVPAYVAFVFRCQSESVAADILNVLRQAFAVSQENLKKERLVQSCDHCPMVWYRQLCSQVEGLSCEERIQLVILKYINGLLEEDGDSILAKFNGAEPTSIQQQNELLMMLLRVHCEAKQVKHIHDTTQNRHEFLNQYLGGGTILLKAKRSLTNSFDQLIKRKGRELSTNPSLQEDEVGQGDGRSVRGAGVTGAPPVPSRPRSSTLGSLSGQALKDNLLRNRRTSTADSPTPNDNLRNSPMMNLFQKVGSQSKAVQSETSARRSGSWRHAIFKKVVSPLPPTSSPHHPVRYPSTPLSSKSQPQRKRHPSELRELWRTAINQQIILIRMEKQNIRIKAKQEEADVKRMKLSYKEVGTCDEEANETWDLIISQTAVNPNRKCDIQLLNSALLRGVPQHKRGQVWQFLIEQRGRTGGGNTNFSHLNLETPYDQLLRQLTSQQHAILIDLGRTFPSHRYFSSALESGQLALFNILKAYSLLDTDVGYCQGLSFVAGLLLMHLEEEEAFSVLKYIMFDLGAREHYKPDMHELQVKLYQLTRLLHDQDQDLLLLLNHYDVLPSLYAAPWFLTLFASQFSVGVAVRVLDVLLLHGVDVIAKFAVVIILDHKRELMECTGLEQVMECFKTVVTNVSSRKLDTYIRKVLESDWDKQMLTYAVEYSVMNDEAFHAFLTESSSTSSAPLNGSSTKYLKGQWDKCSQTDSSLLPQPAAPNKCPVSLSGEKHPILGDLIQRQNSEITKLKNEKCELRKQVATLLSNMVTMQKLARIGSEGKLSVSVAPEVTEIAAKYFSPSGSTYSALLERSGEEGPRGQDLNRYYEGDREWKGNEATLRLNAASDDSSNAGSTTIPSSLNPATRAFL